MVQLPSLYLKVTLQGETTFGGRSHPEYPDLSRAVTTYTLKIFLPGHWGCLEVLQRRGSLPHMLVGHGEVTGLRFLGLLGQDVIHLFLLLTPGMHHAFRAMQRDRGKVPAAGAAASMVTSWHLWHRKPFRRDGDF